MKRKLCVAVICFTAELFAPKIGLAQGMIYISNLGESSTGNVPVGNDAWLAQSFQTGNSSGGYTLNSLQLATGMSTGTPTGFAVLLYMNNGSSPGSIIGALSGSTSPSPGGLFTYTATGITLSPSTTYWFVVTDQTPLSIGAYHMSTASFFGYNFSDNWSMDRFYESSIDGSQWTPNSIGYDLQFAINATPIPEPSAAAVLLLGGGLCLFARCTSKK